jgi:hypothetical protein
MDFAANTALPNCAGARGIAESLYYSWSKEFLEAGKRRLAGDTARAATTDEVRELRRDRAFFEQPQFEGLLGNHLLQFLRLTVIRQPVDVPMTDERRIGGIARTLPSRTMNLQNIAC